MQSADVGCVVQVGGLMEALGGLLALVSAALFIVSVIAIIRPLPKLKLPTRGRAVVVAIGSFVLMGIAGSMLPPPDESAAANAVPKAAPPADIKAETQALWTELTEAVGGCDTASNEVAAIFESSKNPYEIYPIINAAAETCTDAGLRVGKLRSPASSSGDAKKGLDDALDRCSTAYAVKGSAYSKVAKVLDGDARPSAVSEASESMEMATVGQWSCVAAFFAAAEKAGVPMGEIGGAKKG